MKGETDIRRLIAEMRPVLDDTEYVFCALEPESAASPVVNPLATFREAEGTAVIVPRRQAADAGLPYDSTWACITLTVHSSLGAVGFLSRVLNELARAGISVNPISGYYHDHLFVPWESRRKAMDILEAMSRRKGTRLERSAG